MRRDEKLARNHQDPVPVQVDGADILRGELVELLPRSNHIPPTAPVTEGSAFPRKRPEVTMAPHPVLNIPDSR